MQTALRSDSPQDTSVSNTPAAGTGDTAQPTPSLMEVATRALEEVTPGAMQDDILKLDEGPGESPTPEKAPTDAEDTEADAGPQDTDEAPDEKPEPVESETEDTEAAEQPEAQAEESGEVKLTAEDRRALRKSRTGKYIAKLESKAKELETVLRDMSPVAQAMQDGGMSTQDAQTVLQLGAALNRGDWQTFLAGVEPYLKLAYQATGQILPPDLQQQVEQGFTTREIAQQLAQQRSLAQQHEQRLQTMQAQFVQQQRLQAATAVKNSVNEWEADIKTRDPDYAVKEPVVRRIAQGLIAERGSPPSPAAAIELAKEAYAEATRLLSAAKPKPTATKPGPSVNAGLSPHARAEPSSLQEAALAGLRAAHRAR